MVGRVRRFPLRFRGGGAEHVPRRVSEYLRGRWLMEFDLDSADARLRVTSRGQGDPFVLLHAGGESRSVWEPVADLIMDAGAQAIYPDQRGHGQSCGSSTDGLAAYGRDVEALLQHIDNPAVTVVGASLGGLAIMAASADGSLVGRVARVVLVDVIPDPDPAFVTTFLASTVGADSHGSLVEDASTMVQHLRLGTSRFEMPTVLVRGGRSRVVSDDDVSRLLELVPHLLVQVIVGASHLVARDAPAELAAAILDR